MHTIKELFENLVLSAEDISALKAMYTEEIPSLSDEDFYRFFKDGSRLEYENKYFLKRKQLAVRFMLCRLNFNEYLPKLCEVILSICSERSWALPAHIKDCGKPEIDLFAVETAQSLAEIKYLLKLPDTVEKRISSEIETRVLKPFEDDVFPWETSENNWAAVCGGCVGMTMLYESPRRFLKQGKRFENIMRSYIAGFGNDGVCGEGLTYYNYGFGFFMFFIRAYEEWSGRNDIVSENPKIQRIARFGEYMHLQNGCAVSFSDSGRTFSLQKSLSGLISEYFKFEQPGYSERFDNCFRFAFFLRSYLYEAAEKKCTDSFKYFENSQWYIVRKERFSFAAKGGDNGGSHNHNDVGSFIFAVNGKQIIADFGAGEYTKDYFSDKRYDNPICSSFGHSVPIIDNNPQCSGKEYRAGEVYADKTQFGLNIGSAYNPVCSVRRCFKIKDSGIELSDEYKFNGGKHNITERFVSLIKPEISKGGVKIGEVNIKCSIEPKVTETEVKNHTGSWEKLYFIDYASENAEEFRILFEFEVT